MTDPAGDLVVDTVLTIPGVELSWRFTGSGGPGGQHANTANTKVELRWDPAISRALDDERRHTVVARLGSPVVVVAADERSQYRNREIARQRLADKVRASLAGNPPRVPTGVPRSVNERRLADKRRVAERKQERRGDAGTDAES